MNDQKPGQDPRVQMFALLCMTVLILAAMILLAAVFGVFR